MDSKWFSEKRKLTDLIYEQKCTYEEIGRLYGCTGSNIKKVAKRIGIDLPIKRKANEKEHFNRKTRYCLNCGKELVIYNGSRGKFCCAQCCSEYQHKKNYERILNGDQSVMRANYSPKAFRNDILKEQNFKCAICGMPTIWNNKPIVFIVDHIDGHASNNHRSNLRCICPNCDSQLDTYKSKNKNGERSYYRYHKTNKN
jgi:ssDNA-binding Zn-finger/Zn-ribbon topoisomerase 1